MAQISDFKGLAEVFEGKLGTSLTAASATDIPVVATKAREEGVPLWGVKIGERTLLTVRQDWVEPVESLIEGITPDELFSVFGCYQLARFALPQGVGLFGPSWYYVGDEETFEDPADKRVCQLSPAKLKKDLDAKIFWHCFGTEAIAGFGIVEDGKLVALATVRDDFDTLWEIGIDVAPAAKGQGLGRAVMGAAGRWILEQGRLVLATTAPWNVPSARTLRSVGLRCVLSDLTGSVGPFKVQPQPLGLPYPGAQIHNLYPEWAINKQIL
jgi:GNAT superfamily N-acetyltransferase